MAQNDKGQNNNENMEKVRNEMKKAQADQVGAGENHQTGVPIDYTSRLTGKRYTGTVVFKRPSTMDLMEIGAEKSEYLRLAGVVNLELVDESVRFLAHVMAYLKKVVVKNPDWFMSIGTIEDTDIIYEVYGKYREWENSFRPQFSGNEEGDRESSEGAEVMDA